MSISQEGSTAPAPAGPATQPGRVMAITALVATLPLWFLGYLTLLGAAMATGGGDERYDEAFECVAPWVFWAWVVSVAGAIVLCALLPGRGEGREAARRWVASAQFVLLVVPTIVMWNLPFPD
ncbi:hypothetical protein RM780_25590 [Streptomyces sp. DSM 44917]|uniref:Integral membrane protein n=1 Tax=Streptomyces boetiae TaxID=3075541 RepID=A0ABU2LFE0_9ACTN|nr:hypothetical protein [Streptomyces sp. DSM 44917]MDT0310296.1 hypothetical protein [Streptomyces sp. DSM 44917]